MAGYVILNGEGDLMRILLIAVNAKYIHSNLAVYSLRAYARRRHPRAAQTAGGRDMLQIDIAEYTINQQQDDILRDIYEREPDVLCISCYIWNLTCVEALVRELKKIRPELEIWLGGPEVSYDAEDVLLRLPEVRGVMRGEGEVTFSELCGAYADGLTEAPGSAECVRSIPDKTLGKIAGIVFRKKNGEICENAWREPADLDEIPFVYEDMQEFTHRIVYYETSRGCPFSCSYCLSSIDKKLRLRSMALVERELQFFLDRNVEQVKFVDRTFNCVHEHAQAVWQYIAEHDNGVTNFHFEISADLLNEEEIALLRSMRPGLVQLEIGVQSTNPDTIREIRRMMDFGRLADNVGKIRSGGNIHQHLDLIAGLPYEDVESFRRSFDDVYALRPQQLQLGFLKVLKGSYMEENAERYGLMYKAAPPYEVLGTKWLSYRNILELKGIEEMVEVYYNSGQFFYTLEALAGEYDSAYQMYGELWEYYRTRGYHSAQHKRSGRYEILLDFVAAGNRDTEKYRELLIFDYYLRENAKTRPDFAGENAVDKESVRVFYEREEKEHLFLPAYAGYDRNQMRRMTHIEHFPRMGQALLFDYMQRDPLNRAARICDVSEALRQTGESGSRAKGQAG